MDELTAAGRTPYRAAVIVGKETNASRGSVEYRYRQGREIVAGLEAAGGRMGERPPNGRIIAARRPAGRLAPHPKFFKRPPPLILRYMGGRLLIRRRQ